MRIVIPITLATAAILASCALPPEERAARDAAEAARIPAATPVGKAVDCISTSRISDTEVHTDSVIDFRMRGGDVYRNRLPVSCPGLAAEDRFTYSTHTDQLCSIDTITVLYAPPQRGATCGLGQFQPVKLATN